MKAALFAATAALCVSCVGTSDHPEATTPAAPVSELVFRGTVISITGPTTNFFQPWVVTTKVDKVLSGTFSGKQFQFSVHSPAQSNLDVGKHYTIRAVQTKTGYTVDELQWISGAHGESL